MKKIKNIVIKILTCLLKILLTKHHIVLALLFHILFNQNSYTFCDDSSDKSSNYVHIVAIILIFIMKYYGGDLEVEISNSKNDLENEPLKSPGLNEIPFDDNEDLFNPDFEISEINDIVEEFDGSPCNEPIDPEVQRKIDRAYRSLLRKKSRRPTVLPPRLPTIIENEDEDNDN